MVIKKVAVLLLLSVPFLNQAATIQAGQWTTPAKITATQIHENSIYRITTDTSDNTSAVCASSNGAFWWSSSSALSKEMYSMVLAAFASGKKISVVYKDNCNIGAKEVTHISISS